MWYLQKKFISLFFVCTTCIPADVTDNSAGNGGNIQETNKSYFHKKYYGKETD